MKIGKTIGLHCSCNNMNKGFTLIELIISIAIFSGLAFIISMFSLDVLDFGIFLGDNIVAQQEIHVTVRSLVAELRAMSQSANGSYLIESASQNSLVFYSDTDGDGLTERIRYFLSGTTLMKGVIKPEGIPIVYLPENERTTESVHNIYSPAGNLFSYYDSSFTGSESELSFPINIPSVRLVKVNLTADPNPLDPSSRISFYTFVNIRNL